MPDIIDRAEVKAEAKELLRAARVSPLRMTLLFLGIDLGLELISTAVSDMLGDSIGVLSFSFSFVGVLITLLSTVLLAGYTSYCLGVQRGRVMPYDSLFDAFPFAGKVILLSVVQGALIGFGLVLFIVPGVVLAFMYPFALYHLCEEPDIGVIESMRRSRLEMKGYKFQLFALLISFWPLLLLAAVALGACEYFLDGAFPASLGGDLLFALVSGVLTGAAEVYLMPYIELAQVCFYRRVTAANFDRFTDMEL
ncbi:MAG: DUF975 family protein [Oscillospiraceae bacterium]|nr:DUF975 family protein [Oscillospiraceae bacterium]